MSGKRQATSDLNHDNWDREEEPEKRGSFSIASEDELRNRVIKKARRKVAGNDGAAETVDGGASKSVFSGFAGFGNTPTTPASNSASPFSFLSKIPVVANATVTPTFSFGNTAKSPKTATQIEKLPTKPATESSKTAVSESVKADGEKSSGYYAKLKGLNQEVSSWIKTHVDKNPLCILTPVFKDYENHLKNIDTEEVKKGGSVSSTTKMTYNVNKSSASTPLSSFTFSATTTNAPTSSTHTTSAAPFSFGGSAAFAASTSSTISSAPVSTNIFGGSSKAPSVEPPKSNGFNFGLKTVDKTNTTSTASTGFTFGTSVDDTKKTTGFSFTPGDKPFSFGNIQPPAAIAPSTSAAKTDGEDDEDQPPKVEFKQVVEDDAVYSKKCKVFVKKDATFADRGVGTLYLKPVKDSEKTQLLVRADTNLGNILVNLILNDAIPTQRMGKNNVMMVCLPTPDAEKSTSLLLRVKTGDEADELLQTLNKYKK